MKVIQINSVCGIGSTGRIATDIHNILIEQGHDSYIAYGRDLPINCENTIKIGIKFDNYTHVIKTRILDRHGLGSRRATLEFVNKIKELDPDIIHLHNIHGYYVNIKILFDYLKESDKPVVWTLHDCWAFTGHCSHFDYISCYKWQTGCFDCPQKKSYPSSVLVDNSRNNYRIKKELFTGLNNLTIITPSKWLADVVMKSFLKEYPIKVINNGIDLQVFKPIKSNFRESNYLKEEFIILGVANVWTKSKGFNYFMDLSKNLSHDEIIVMLGLDEEQMKIIPSNIIGIPRLIDIRDLASIYATSDVFLNPTLSDTFPTTNLESLACGTPVITFKTGGSPEAIDKQTGIVVEKDNFLGILDAIKIIKNNKKAKYSRNCIQRAKRLYNKNDKFLTYLDLYKKVLHMEEYKC